MPLRIGIIGGGIAGLTLAVALSQINLENLIEVDIYESAPELTQVGAGITLWPRAWKILEKIGVGSALADHLSPGQQIPDGKARLGFKFRKADQRLGDDICDLVFAGAALPFHRSIVQNVLLDHLSSAIRCHLSRRLASYTQTPTGDSIQLVFEDGSTAICDVLVGADGIKSVVRKQFVKDAENQSECESKELNADPIWSGTLAYRCLIDSKIVAHKMPGHRALTTPVVYCGKNQHLVAYPILQGKVVNIIAFVSELSQEGKYYDGPSFQDVRTEEVITFFDNWEEEVRVLVHSMENPSRWTIHAIEPLQCFSSNAVFLLGDAAHAMTPHQGNGAGQAIEDGYVLAHLIAKAVKKQCPISLVAKAYDEIRRPFANFVLRASRMHGLLYEFNALGFEDVKEGESLPPHLLKKLGELIIGDWEYAWSTTAEGDLAKALAML